MQISVPMLAHHLPQACLRIESEKKRGRTPVESPTTPRRSLPHPVHLAIYRVHLISISGFPEIWLLNDVWPPFADLLTVLPGLLHRRRFCKEPPRCRGCCEATPAMRVFLTMEREVNGGWLFSILRGVWIYLWVHGAQYHGPRGGGGRQSVYARGRTRL